MPDDDITPYLHAYFGTTDLTHLRRSSIALALTRGGFRVEAEAVLGRAIHHPATQHPVPDPDTASYRTQSEYVAGWLARHPPKQRRVRFISRNPRLPTTPAWYRYNLIRVGMTEQQLHSRGVTPRDIREARQAGWITMS